MVGGAVVEPGLLAWVPRFTGGDWHAAKKATVAQNKWLWRPLRIGESIKSATVRAAAQVRAKPHWLSDASNVIATHQYKGGFKEWS